MMLAGTRVPVRNVFRFLERRAPGTVFLISLGLVAILGVVDYFTGWEVSLAVFYLAPVGIAAWYIGPRATTIFAGICALTWAVTNALAGETHSSPWVPYWNAMVRLAFFLVVGQLVLLLRRTMVQLREALDREQKLAREDALTGTRNARAFYERAEQDLRLSARTSRPTTLAYLDVDGFKAVNDLLGHAAGDRLLRVMGEVLVQSLRSTDTVARLGGDEFVLLLPDTDADAARLVLEKVQDALGAAMRANAWDVTFSIGALSTAGADESVDVLVHDADQLMYTAKRRGRNLLQMATRTSSTEGAGRRRAVNVD